MKPFQKLILLVLLTVAGASVQAQFDQTLYNMRIVPQSQYQNPAFIPDHKVNITLPILPNIYANFDHSGFRYKHLIHFNPTKDSLVVDPDLMLSKLGNKNFLVANFYYDILGVGFRVKENYFNLTIRSKLDLGYTYPRDFMDFLWNGNFPQYLGADNRADFSKFGFDVSAYTEIGVGYARDINEQWHVGGKLKYLNGLANVYTRRSDFGISTNENTFGWTLDGDFNVNTSIPGVNPYFAFDDDSTTDMGTPTFPGIFSGNHGVGIDLGAKYNIDDQWSVHASLVDLGAIRWKVNAYNATLEDANFTFDGVDIKPFFTSDSADFGAIADTLLDSLQGAFDIQHTNDAYWAPTMPRFHVGGNYQFHEKMNAGLLFTGAFYKGIFRPAVTASYNLKLGRALTLAASYSWMNRDFTNLGLGFSLNAGFFQWYAATDNLLGPIFPQSAKKMHLHTGFNLTFGYKKKDRDQDGIEDKKDHCPDTPGLVEYNGCPDTDLDGIPDPDDACPEVAGLPEFSGCPDTDKDGITDTLDGCPTEPGPIDLNGCPDRDNDKIIDKEDACPDEAGPANTKGCPDRDSDTVIDKEDECPDKWGPVDHKGCPDSDGDGLYDNEDRCPDDFGPTDNMGCPYGDLDGDGIFDKEDRCPDTPGPKENNGCPYGDLDGDGVTDNEDECPNTPGTIENKGCPEIAAEEQEIINTAFDNLEFESGKDVIRSTSYESLDSLASLLKRKPDWKLKIAGHTDNVGAAAANLALSKKRANAVMKYLNIRGINDETRFIVEFYGEERPIYPNNTAEGRQKNRRVEMEVVFE